MKARYSALTRDLDWEPSYVEFDKLYPHVTYEGIKIHDWSKPGSFTRLGCDRRVEARKCLSSKGNLGLRRLKISEPEGTP
jgi:hypothetical protein